MPVGGHISLWARNPARLISLLAIGLAGYAAHMDARPPNPRFPGRASCPDAAPFTIVRHDALLSGSKGTPLLAGDIVATGPGALLVIAAADGTLVGLGPSTDVYFLERAEVPTLFVRKGWVKADVKSGVLRI